MKKVEIKYSELLFLYAYLRLIDLSLDRSRWTAWGEFQSYFEKRVYPSQVIQYLKDRFLLHEADLAQIYIFPKRKDINDRLKASIFKRFLLSQGEFFYCCRLLLDFEKILKSDIQSYNPEAEKLRIDIATFYSEVLGSIISNKDLDELMKIEHFFQNENIEVIELSAFIPDDFKT